MRSSGFSLISFARIADSDSNDNWRYIEGPLLVLILLAGRRGPPKFSDMDNRRILVCPGPQIMAGCLANLI